MNQAKESQYIIKIRLLEIEILRLKAENERLEQTVIQWRNMI